MNKFGTVFPFILLLASCSQTYPSKIQAREACMNWLGVNKKIQIIQTGNSMSRSGLSQKGFYPRSCKLEVETKQYLGIEYPTVADGSFKKFNDSKWRSSSDIPSPESKITKYFRY